MGIIKCVVNSRALLWLLLFLPAFPVLVDFVRDERYYPELMFDTGWFAIQLLILTLAITPITLLLRRRDWAKPVSRWLIRSRRHFGVSVFAYSLLHTLIYLRQNGDFEDIIYRAGEPALLTGWLALIIFFPLAITSNNFSVRALGETWKFLHRFVYPASALVLLHWFYFELFIDDAFLWVFTLALLQAYRVFHQTRRHKNTIARI